MRLPNYGFVPACWIAAGALCLLALLAPTPAHAVVLEVRDITVDVTAESAAEAREEAILEAHRKAFTQLVADLTGGDPAPPLSDAEIAALVHDFSITDERASAVRYIGTFDFRFRREGLRAVIGVDAPVIAARPAAVVIVPVYRAGEEQTLWDEPNPWRDVWARHASSRHLVPTLMPLGDLEDVATIGAEEAIAGHTEPLMALARRYDAETALVALAVVGPEDAPAGPAVTVTTVLHGGAGPGAPLVAPFEAMPGESLADLLDRAAAAVHADIQDRVRQEAVVAATAPTMIDVSVPITGLNDWITVRSRLQNQRLVRETDIVRLSREEVRLNLHFSGEVSELAEALQQDGLDLVRNGERWTLLPPDAPRPD